MGGGSWDARTYHTYTSTRAASGIRPFDYSSKVSRGAAKGVHETLDPKKRNSEGNIVREALDSDEHPESTPVAVIFDVTGSMGGIPRVLQTKLGDLLGVLQRRGYITDPQILFGAVGDEFSDQYPLQVGQFESDIRLAETLENTILEGGGGGGNHESYQLAAYFLAKYSNLDINKRGGKGYLFLIGDERVYANVTRNSIVNLIGDNVEEGMTTQEVFDLLREKYEVFFLFASQGSYRADMVLTNSGKAPRWGYVDNSKEVLYWSELLGDHALILDDADAVCETIAMVLATFGAGLTVEEAATDLVAVGSDGSAVRSASRAVSVVVNESTASGGLATTTGNVFTTSGVAASRF